MRVYIPYFSIPYEGYSSPLGCFISEEDMWMAMIAEFGEKILEDENFCFDEYDINA